VSSIRQSLAKWLVLWISLLWAFSGVGIYLALKRNLESNLDRNLEIVADKARILDQRDGSFMVKFFPTGIAFPTTNPGVPLFEPGSNFYYQAWDTNSGRLVAESNNLSTESLSWRSIEGDERLFWNDRMSDGSVFRSLGLQIRRGPAKGRKAVRLNLVVANNRAYVDVRIRHLVVILLTTSIAGLIITWLIVRTVVNRGLSPLYEMGDRLSSVEPQNLELRVMSDGLPVELQPVSRALIKLVERMEEGFERERRFSGDVAHEFRTPIAELRAMAEVAIRWPHRASPDDYQEVLSISLQMEEVIEALLELSRVEGGSVAKGLSPVLLQAEILKCWEPYSEKAASKHIELFCDVAESTVINANAGMLDLILKNLLENAVEYSPEGEQIVVSLEQESDNTYWLTVENLAINLQFGDVEHLFERFWRGDDSRTGVRHTGLGLSLSDSCARTMGMELIASLSDARELTIRLGRLVVANVE